MSDYVIGYKSFNHDWTCRGMYYEVGKSYFIDNGEPLELCKNGFHFCSFPPDCNIYYPQPSSKHALIEASGTMINEIDKSVTSNIRIIREISSEEWKQLQTGQFECMINRKKKIGEGREEILIASGSYKEGKLDGLQQRWYDGLSTENLQNLRFQRNYKDGKPDGLWEYWYNNGNLTYRHMYKNGQEDGLWEDWYYGTPTGDPYGKQKNKINYKNGYRDGKSEGWYDKSLTKDPNTVFKHFEINYKKGIRDGEYKEWYDNGSQWCKGNYKIGVKDGLWSSWDENGILLSETKYSLGLDAL